MMLDSSREEYGDYDEEQQEKEGGGWEIWWEK